MNETLIQIIYLFISYAEAELARKKEKVRALLDDILQSLQKKLADEPSNNTSWK